MKDRIRVAILTGGKSSEREIALKSAETIQFALSNRFDLRVFDLPSELESFLRERDWADIAIPVFHGTGGEDGTVQGMLKTLGIPFIFSDVTAHAVALEKGFTKDVVSAGGMRTATYKKFSRGDECVFALPAVVKPVDGGSSIGISIVKTQKEFEEAMEGAFLQANTVLVEEYIEGDEYTVAVIEEKGEFVALPVVQIVPKQEFFDFESKYDADLVEEICPANINEDLATKLKEEGLLAHQLIGAKHLSRSDFIVDKEGVSWFLEINTIPGATLESLVPKALKASGRDFGVVLGEWIKSELSL